jgi:hypothetical protein
MDFAWTDLFKGTGFAYLPIKRNPRLQETSVSAVIFHSQRD